MIFRNFINFSDPSTFRSLYFSLIRPHLKCTCIIWETWTSKHCNKINMKIKYYGQTSKDRKPYSYSVVFLSKLLNNHISNPFILRFISFRINHYNIKNKQLLFVPHSSKNSYLIALLLYCY